MSALISDDIAPVRKTTFVVESGAVMQRLRSGISEMLKAMPSRVRTTRDLQKVFGVDVKLCWQVLKLAGPGDALSLAPFVPTPGPMKRFLNAASTAGVDSAVVEKVSSAYDAFKEQITIHAGDRQTFEAMATSAAGLHEGSSEDLQKAAVRLRKSAFQTASHYAGVQVDTYLGASFIHPAAMPGMLDAVNLRIRLGVRRLRPTATISVDQTKLVSSESGTALRTNELRRENLDEESARKYGAAILPQFSSNPLPEFETVSDSDGRFFTRLAGKSVGRTGAVDLVFGQSIFNAPYTDLFNGKKLGFGSSVDITTPVMVMILDKLVHRPSFPQLETEFTVAWMNAPAAPVTSENDLHLPFAERLVRLDAGVDGARTHEVPNYFEMLEYVCQKRDWKIDEFDVYRVRIEYPLHFTRLWTKFAPVPAITRQ